MRIRKRSVPLPFSNLCPISLSDPQLNKASSSSPLQLHREQERKEAGVLHLYPVGDHSLSLNEQITHHDHHHRHQLSDSFSPSQSLRSPMAVEDRPRSDLQVLITRERNGWVCSDVGEINKGAQKKKKESEELEEEEEEKRLRMKEKSNNLRKGSILGAEAEPLLPLVSTSSHQVGRWCQGEKAIPLKKRRGSFELKVSEEEEEETIAEKMKKMKTKMKSKTNKKCDKKNDDDDDDEGKEKDHRGKGMDTTNYNVKKREKGSILMEGSRCSRVNGRGWRCCQQTLVGYSLCEHHLGKGRLRSMSSVRSRAPAIGKPNDDDGVDMELRSSSLSSVQDKEGHVLLDGVGDEDEEKPLMITKKRKKFGMVKARSISSLLGQTNNTSAAVDNNN